MNRILFSCIALVIMFLSCKHTEFEDIDKQAIKDRAIIQQYLSDHQLTADTTSEGLFYIIHEPGTGITRPDRFSTIKVFYSAYFPNQHKFDSTTTTPRTFQLSKSLKGWQIGVPLMKKGGKATLLVPSRLGYGTTGYTTKVYDTIDNQVTSHDTTIIPSNAVLIFDIELLSFTTLK